MYIYRAHRFTPPLCPSGDAAYLRRFGRGDDTVGNPHRAQISQFELFELILLSKLDRQLPVEQFEATVSQSTVPSPPLNGLRFHRGGPAPGAAARPVAAKARRQTTSSNGRDLGTDGGGRGSGDTVGTERAKTTTFFNKQPEQQN